MKSRTAWPVAGAVTLLASTATVGSAQTRRPLTLVSLAEIPRVQDAQLSPDGRVVSYTLARADWTANRQVPHLWLQTIGAGAPLQITNGDSGESLARWSPDSRTLAFVARGDNGSQIFVVPAAGGTPRPLTRHQTSVYGGAAPVWSPDGAWIYFLAADPPTPEQRERERLHDDLAFYGTNYQQRHLWRVRVSDGAETRLTDGAFSVIAFRLSRDGGQLVEQRTPTPAIGDAHRGDVWLEEAAGARAHRLTSNDIEENEAELSPDNTRVLFLADANARFEPYFSSALFVVPAQGGAPRALCPDFPYAIDHATWAPDGRSILATVNQGVHSEIYRFDAETGGATALTDGRHSVQFWSLSPAAQAMVFQFDEPDRLGDVWTLAAAGGTPRRVTGVYDSLARDGALPREETITWSGADGTTVEGLLFYPLGYQRDQRYPLVVQLHGGPQESDKYGLGPGVILNYVPVLTARGYAVLRPNYRGSAGYGNAFLRDVVGGYFRQMHLDVIAGVDALVQRGIADPDRLAVMGWSAGGHLTNKLLTSTTRFKAASSAAGAANWISMFAETDTRESRAAWFGGLPWGPNAPVESFWNNSPIKDAASITTPTLIFAGQEDTRVPMAQAIELFRALEANHVPVRLGVAPREGHQWTELRHQLQKANAELEWFEHYVMARPYVWERAPGDQSDAEIQTVWK